MSRSSQGEEVSFVLLVAGDAAMRDALGFSLTRAGLAVHAVDAAMLREHPEPGRLSCLVIDHAPPGHDGFETLARLRPQHSAAPVVLLTELADRAMCARAEVERIDFVLERPLLDDALVNIVLAAVRPQKPGERGVRSTT